MTLQQKGKHTSLCFSFLTNFGGVGRDFLSDLIDLLEVSDLDFDGNLRFVD